MTERRRCTTHHFSDKISYYLPSSIRLDCENDMARLLDLQQQTEKQQVIVKDFENNNKAYVKITKTVEEKMLETLPKGRELLGAAVLSVLGSIRNNPDKYSSLIHYDEKASMQFYYYAYGQQQEQQHIL